MPEYVAPGAYIDEADPEWKYVNVRRHRIFLEESIDEGLQWVVFEPNDEALWAGARRVVEDFLFARWRGGAFAEASPDEAFFVRCDRSTMTQNDLDDGRLVCLIGVAPMRPAEFVIFRMGRWTAQPRLGAHPFLVAIDGMATAGFAEASALPDGPDAPAGGALAMRRGLTAGPLP